MICHENVAYSCVSLCLDRWVHAVCESLYTEDEVEQASDEGFACTYCAPYVPKPVGKCDNKAKTPSFLMRKHNLVLFFLILLFSLHHFCIVVESAIMASIKIKEPGEWYGRTF